MIAWREKFYAFALHFLVTLLLAAGAAALIFLVWFPDPFQTMVGGSALFVLVVGCDLALGPLISLVIYDSRKSRRQLVLDYGVVAAVQIAALIYGVFVVSSARPIYVAYVKDRLEVVTAIEIDDADLQDAIEARYRSRPKWGPQFVATAVPPEDHNDVLFTALEGKDVTVRPRYYVPYESQLDQIKERAQPLSALAERHAEAKQILSSATQSSGIPPARLRWLPVKHRRGFWTALIDLNDGRPVRYLPIDPY